MTETNDPEEKDSISINELADHFGATLRTFRFYEQKGLIKPRRVGFNQRSYSKSDLERLEFIFQCRDIGIPVAAIKDIMDSAEEGVFCTDKLVQEIENRLDLMTKEAESLEKQISSADAWLTELNGPSKVVGFKN